MDKTARHEAIRERARAALRDLYHNATLTYPREQHGRTEAEFQSWLEDTCQGELDYIRDGGAYPGNYRATLAHPANAGRYKSERARAYYVAKGMRARDEERADCGALTGWRALEIAAGNKAAARILKKYPGATRHNAQWERIGEFGKLYTWGRGGRTLAPNSLIRTGGGGSFSVKEDYADDMAIEAVMDLIRVVESFNAHVAAFCKGIPEQWRDYCRDLASEARAEKRRARELAREESRRLDLMRCFC